MNLSVIEILASILIILAVVKVIILILNPQIWLNFISKIYTVPIVMTVIGFILSVLVLYFIVNAGISIVEILAVCLFIALLMLTGLANYAGDLVAWIKQQEIVNVIKNLWLYSAMWLFLIIWGIYILITE
ncbi:MAG: hypothetical protein R8G33_03995 [Gammaproteobacteria bacterium]|nr:hypothetical protein [Gammaproteobacteria bacterium]